MDDLGPKVRLAVSGSESKTKHREKILAPPSVRLAYGGPPKALDAAFVPAVRLSVGGNENNRDSPRRTAAFQDPAPAVRLAAPHKDEDSLPEVPAVELEGAPPAPERLPALLVSYFYLKGFLKQRDRWAFRDWALDSGAFSAKNSGKDISLDDYISTCKELKSLDGRLTDIFSLDVIGDWRASKVNTDKMWAAGVEAFPTFHIDEPWDVLKGLAADYPKVALGGVALLKGKKKKAWLTECFSRVWPKKLHGFGCSSRDTIMSLPFHSVDATNWELAPCKFGNWHSFGQMSVRGSEHNLRAEVEFFLKLEQEAQTRWRKEMLLLESASAVVPVSGSSPSLADTQS